VLIACDLLNGMIEGRFKESDSFGYSIEDLLSMDHAENLTSVRIRKTVQKRS
jgi:hypothetical protein